MKLGLKGYSRSALLAELLTRPGVQSRAFTAGEKIRVETRKTEGGQTYPVDIWHEDGPAVLLKVIP